MPFKCHYGTKIACYGVLSENLKNLPPALELKYTSDLTNTEQIVEIPINITEIDQSSAAIVIAVGKYFDTISGQELVNKSIKFQVLSNETAFLGVENIENPNSKCAENYIGYCNESKSLKCKSSIFSFKKSKKRSQKRSQQHDLDFTLTCGISRGEEMKMESNPNAEQIEDLISLQKIDGHWDCSNEVKRLVKSILNLNKNIENEDTGFITALILAILEEKFREFENIWCFVASKSRKWLKKNEYQEIRLADLGYS